MKLKIEHNPINGGYCATFEHDGNECYADIYDIGFGLPTALKEYVFTTTGPNITAHVAPTMEALGDQDWQVTLLDSYGKQIEYRVVYAASGLEAATEAVNDWLEANGLDTTFSVSL